MTIDKGPGSTHEFLVRTLPDVTSPVFPGYVGLTCQKCKATVNGIYLDGPWLCECKTVNETPPPVRARPPHDVPDVGPTRMQIEDAYKRLAN
jgi:hypothetical protein